MIEVLRPVSPGILIGLSGFIFGIGWAFFLVLGHESMHRSLEYRAAHAASIKGDVNGDEHAMSIGGRGHMEEAGMKAPMDGAGAIPSVHEAAHTGLHDSPLMALAHERLARGHVHAMGLGLVTVLVSLVLAFTSAPSRLRTIVLALTGVGGIIYPFSWIIMGYRTPALGPEAAEASVIFIAAPGVALVLLGVFTSAGFLLKDIFSKSTGI